MSKGVLTVVSGFSGAGKGTVMKRLLEKYENYALSISVTTRKPREGERDGIEYFFRTREEVEAMIQEDQLLEHAEYVGNYYGTPRFYVEDMLSQGKNVILEIEIQGAMKIKEKIPEAVLVFVTPPTIEELRSRLTGRGTETADVIASRLRRAAEESEGMNNCHFEPTGISCNASTQPGITPFTGNSAGSPRRYEESNTAPLIKRPS